MLSFYVGLGGMGLVVKFCIGMVRKIWKMSIGYSCKLENVVFFGYLFLIY